METATRRTTLRGILTATLGGIGLSVASGSAGAMGDGRAILLDVDDDGVYGVRLDEDGTPGSANRPEAVHAHTQPSMEGTNDYAITMANVASENSTLQSVDELSFDYYEASDNEFAAPDEVWLRVATDDGTRYLVNHAADPNRGRETWHTFAVIAGGSVQMDGDWLVLTEEFDRRGRQPLSAFADAYLLNAGAGKGAPVSRQMPHSNMYYDNLVLDNGRQESAHVFPATAQDERRSN